MKYVLSVAFATLGLVCLAGCTGSDEISEPDKSKVSTEAVESSSMASDSQSAPVD